MALKDFLAMPNILLLMEQAQQKLQEEKTLRQHFYKIIDENTKMEFINGEIVFQSPVKKMHNDATGNIYIILKLFVNKFDLGWVGIEKTLVSLTRNDYEPDVCFWKKEKADKFRDDQMQFPAPDLVVEVLSPKTAKTDRTTKYIDYEAHGIKEYWIIDPKKKEIEQYILINGQYYLRFKGHDGAVMSEAVEGFATEVEILFNQNSLNEVLAKWL